MFSKTEFCLLNFIKITISRYFRISFKPFYFAANKLNDLLYEKNGYNLWFLYWNL